jgi:hypothetical protein
MMRVLEHEAFRRTHLPVVKSGGKVCGASFAKPLSSIIILAVAAIALSKPAAAQNGTFTVSAAPGGITFAGAGTTHSGMRWASELPVLALPLSLLPTALFISHTIK